MCKHFRKCQTNRNPIPSFQRIKNCCPLRKGDKNLPINCVFRWQQQRKKMHLCFVAYEKEISEKADFVNRRFAQQIRTSLLKFILNFL